MTPERWKQIEQMLKDGIMGPALNTAARELFQYALELRKRLGKAEKKLKEWEEIGAQGKKVNRI